MTDRLFHVAGPRDAGPGERGEMLEQARALLEEAGASEIVRIDVTERGLEEGSAAEALVPVLQSDSLFGGVQGVEVVDAESLSRAEAEVLAELLGEAQPESVVLVFVSAGALPAPLGKVVRERGKKVEVRKFRERDAAEWLSGELRRRKLSLGQEAVSALLRRFGSDVAALSQALDQLTSVEGTLDREAILARFRNRPDEPMWHYADALVEGSTGEALRRLADFWTHGHPLQLLAFLENDLRRRALATVAPDLETFAEWSGSTPRHFTIRKAWGQRNRISDSELRKALDALARAEDHLKGAPEETHRLTMERLTVALSRWYGGPARRA